MLNISINKVNTVVQNTKTGGQWTVNTTMFFGVVYASLEQNFPNFDCAQFGKVIADHVRNKLAEQTEENTKYLFHCEEIGTSLFNLLVFIDKKSKLIKGRKILTPTLQDIEELRISHRMTTTYLPISIADKDSMCFTHLESVTQVMIAALYYYAYNEYKLTRCKHCGKWFATKTLKEEYCKGISPCFGDIIKGKTPLPCEQAVRNIKQKQSRRHKNVYSYLDISARDQEEIEYFKTESKKFKEAITRSPSVENFKKYEDFLNRYPKRTVRT